MFVVRFEAVDRLAELGVQRQVERIERLRTVEPDDADPAFGFDDDVLIAHGLPLMV